MNFKGRDCVSHVLQCLAGIHERVDKSCKRRAEYLRRSFVIVHTEHGHAGTGTFYTGEVGMPCGCWCNRADFTESSKFPEILGELSMRKQCVPGSFFSAHALEPGVSSHFVNSHFVNAHFINSHLVNFPLCQFPFCQFPFGQC